MKICSVCGRLNNFKYADLCPACYYYFKNGGTINPIPDRGEITYDYRGYPVCHICGMAFEKIGTHVQAKHNISVYEYKECYGICNKTSLTSERYHYVNGQYDRTKNLTQMGSLNPSMKIRKDREVRLQERNMMSERQFRQGKKYRIIDNITGEVNIGYLCEIKEILKCSSKFILNSIARKQAPIVIKDNYIIEKISE